MKEVKTGRYAYSKDGCEYYGDEPDLETAISEAGDAYPAYRLQKLYVGLRVRLELEERDIAGFAPGEWLAAELAGALENEYGEGAGDCLAQATEAQKDELNRAIAAAALAWMRKHGLRPEIYGIKEARKIGELQHAG